MITFNILKQLIKITKTMKKFIILVMFGALVFTGCTNSNTSTNGCDSTQTCASMDSTHMKVDSTRIDSAR